MSTTDPWGTDPEVAKQAAQDTEAAARLERWAAEQARREHVAPQPYSGSSKAPATWHPGDSPVLPEVDPRLYAPDARPLIVNVGPQHARAPYVEPVNHVLHGLLTLFTSGLWAPVWLWKVRAYRKAMRRG
jgi:hypothetical protein